MNALRRELASALAPLALAFAVAAVGAISARTARDAGAATETALLALWAALVLAPLAWATTRGGSDDRAPRARRRIAALAVAGVALAVAMIVALLPRDGASRSAAVSALLVLAVAVCGGSLLGGRSIVDRAPLAALALGGALTAYGHELWVAPATTATLVRLVALPALATAVADLLGRRGRPAAGAIAGGLVLFFPLAIGEPLWLLATLLAFALLGGAGSAASRAHPVLAGSRGVLALAAVATLLAGAFPWLRPAPVATMLDALLTAPTLEQPLIARPRTLDAKRSALELPIDGAPPIRALRLDSYLTHSAALACGTPVATVELVPVSGGESYFAELRIGRDSAEWAADRADVGAALGCAAPPAWSHFLPADRGGIGGSGGSGERFLGRLSRARFELPRPLLASRLIVERNPALADDLAVSLFAVVVER
jgi:hypothetical protein